MRRFALAGLLAVSAPLPGLAEIIPGTEFSTDFWSGAAYTDDRGAFFYCDVSVGYTNGEVLWLGLYSNDTLAVLLTHHDIRFKQGESFDAWLMPETGLPIHQAAEAWDEGYAGMTLQGIDSSIDFLTAGQWLRLLGIGIDGAYDVTGIAEALAAAQACHGRNSGSNPFATATPKPADPVVEPVAEPFPEPEPAPEPAPEDRDLRRPGGPV